MRHRLLVEIPRGRFDDHPEAFARGGPSAIWTATWMQGDDPAEDSVQPGVPLCRGPWDEHGVEWLGERAVFVADKGGRRRLHHGDPAHPGEPPRLLRPDPDVDAIAAASDGSLLAWTAQGQLRIATPPDAEARTVELPAPSAAGLCADASRVFVPLQGRGIHLMDGRLERLTDGPDESPCLSADGGRLLFVRREVEAGTLILLDLAAGVERVVFGPPSGGLRLVHGAFSPDGSRALIGVGGVRSRVSFRLLVLHLGGGEPHDVAEGIRAAVKIHQIDA